MKYKQIFFIYILLSIKIILSNIYQLKKIPSKIKSLHRKHRLLDNNKEDSFLEYAHGDSYDLNYYYATLYLGPKKIPQTYIIDTGSPTTTSPCNKCKTCGEHINKPYEISDSNIIKCYTNQCNSVQSNTCRNNNQCSFSISYSEGSSLEGIFSMQEVYFEQINKAPNITTKSFIIPIGCTTKETHLFKTQLADGILGLNNSGKSFISILYNNEIISKNLFSICFGQSDGYFSIGEIDTTYHKTNIEYVPLIEGGNNFYININKIQIGDKIININYKGFIDSGTTISYFPKDIYKSIINEFNSFCKQKGKKCGKLKQESELGYCGFFKSNKEKLKAIEEYWPNITLHLEGHNYVLTPSDYYFDYNDNDDIGACLGFEGENTNIITIGGTLMHGHDIIFDRENKQIGFSAADCNRRKSNNIDKKTKNDIINIDENSNKEKIVIENNDNKESIKDNIKDKNKENKLIKNEKILLYIILLFSFLFIGLIFFIIITSLRKCLCKRNHQVHIDEIANSENNNRI